MINRSSILIVHISFMEFLTPTAGIIRGKLTPIKVKSLNSSLDLKWIV